jgi:hypothetical protein
MLSEQASGAIIRVALNVSATVNAPSWNNVKVFQPKCCTASQIPFAFIAVAMDTW